MGLLSWIIMGALAGWIASIFMNTNKSMGAVANIIVGILGAFIGGFIMSFINKSGVTGFNLYSLFVSVIGAVVLLAIAKKVGKKL